jgi:hypothetical protein
MANDARLQKISELTQRIDELTAARDVVANERSGLVAEEMADGTTAAVIAKAAGLTVNRIYKLRDNAGKASED